MTSRRDRRMGSLIRAYRIGSCLTAVLMAGVCLVAAGRGNLGPPSASATGGGTLVTTSVNPTFSISPGSGESSTSVTSRLISAINMDANFVATMIGVGSTTFEVLHANGRDLSHLMVSETDPGVQSVGVSFSSSGREWTAINRILVLAGDGNYRLTIDALTGPDYDQTFDTTTSPTNTVAGLNAAIDLTLAQAGFCTFTDNATGLKYVQRPGCLILSTNLSATDSAITSFTVDMTNLAPVSPGGSCSAGPGPIPSAAVSSVGGTPTLSEFGLFILVTLLAGAAVWVIRRKGAHQDA